MDTYKERETRIIVRNYYTPCRNFPESQSFELHKDQPNPVFQSQTEVCPVKARLLIHETVKIHNIIIHQYAIHNSKQNWMQNIM